MNRYQVAVLVKYHVSADNLDDAWELIEVGAEFPVTPFDDETNVSSVQIVSVIDLSDVEEEEE
jgi:hypothetical protein